jgi:hypothetical protein
MLGKPVHDVTMIRGDTLTITFGMADDVCLGQTVCLAQISTKFNGLPVHLLKVRCVRKAVFADLKTDMCVVCRATSVPTSVIPGQSLVGSDRAVGQLANETMDTNLSATGVIGIPMVIVVDSAEKVFGTANSNVTVDAIRPAEPQISIAKTNPILLITIAVVVVFLVAAVGIYFWTNKSKPKTKNTKEETPPWEQ